MDKYLIMKIKPGIIYISIFTLLFSSCKSFTEGKDMNEGIIYYQINYLEDERDNPIITLLPSEMTVKFKDNSTVSDIQGFMGFFEMKYIANTVSEESFALLKIMGKKYVYQVENKGLNMGYELMTDLHFEDSDGTKIIAGYKCKQKKATCSVPGIENFDIYYTDEINIKNPNIGTPFKDIEGVLMEFNVNQNGINMLFTVKSVEQTDIDSLDFKIPDGYKKVDKNEMKDIIKSFNPQK